MPIKWVKISPKYDDMYIGIEIPPYNVVYIIPFWKHKAEIDQYCRKECPFQHISTDVVINDKMPFFTCMTKDCPFKIGEEKFYKKIGKNEYYLRRLQPLGKDVKVPRVPYQSKLTDFTCEEKIKGVPKDSTARGDRL